MGKGAAGRMTRSPRRARAGRAPRRRKVQCVFWLRGDCRNGDTCRFAHYDTAEPHIEPEPLADNLVDEVRKFLEENGGQLEGGQVAARFIGMKQAQLVDHFEIVRVGKGKFWVRLHGLEDPVPDDVPKVKGEQSEDGKGDDDASQIDDEFAEDWPDEGAEDQRDGEQEEEDPYYSPNQFQDIEGTEEGDFENAQAGEAPQDAEPPEDLPPESPPQEWADDEWLHDDQEEGAHQSRNADHDPFGDVFREAMSGDTRRAADSDTRAVPRGFRPIGAPIGGRGNSGVAPESEEFPLSSEYSPRSKGLGKQGSTKRSRQRCLFYPRGQCRNGDKCPFVHTEGEEPEVPPIDEEMVYKIRELLEAEGGAMEGGRLSKEFKGIRRVQLEDHFVIEGERNGKFLVKLPTD